MKEQSWFSTQHHHTHFILTRLQLPFPVARLCPYENLPEIFQRTRQNYSIMSKLAWFLWWNTDVFNNFPTSYHTRTYVNFKHQAKALAGLGCSVHKCSIKGMASVDRVSATRNKVGKMKSHKPRSPSKSSGNSRNTCQENWWSSWTVHAKFLSGWKLGEHTVLQCREMGTWSNTLWNISKLHVLKKHPKFVYAIGKDQEELHEGSKLVSKHLGQQSKAKDVKRPSLALWREAWTRRQGEMGKNSHGGGGAGGGGVCHEHSVLESEDNT